MLPTILGIDNNVSLGGEKYSRNGRFFDVSVYSFGSTCPLGTVKLTIKLKQI